MKRILTLAMLLLVFTLGLGSLSNSRVATANSLNQVGLEVSHGYWIFTSEDIVSNVPMSRFNNWGSQITNWQDYTGQPVIDPSITIVTDKTFVGFSPFNPTISDEEYQWNFSVNIPENVNLGVGAQEPNYIEYGRPGFRAERHVFPETLVDPITIQNLAITLTLEDPLPVDVNEFDIDIAPGRFVFQQKQLVNYTVLSTNDVEDWSAWSGGWSANPSNIVVGKTYHFMATFEAVKSPDLQGSPIAKPGVLIHFAHWGRLGSMSIGSSIVVTHPEGPRVTFSAIGEYEWHADVSCSRQDFWFNEVVSEIIENPNPPPPYAVTVPATIDVDPDTLNLKSQGKWITGYVELPEGYDVADINVSSVLLNGTIPVDPSAPSAFIDIDPIDGDYDLLSVKFNRTAVSELILSEGIMFGNVTLAVNGRLGDGTVFEGSDVILAKMPGDVNGDCKVDMRDIGVAANAFGCHQGQARWNPAADENEDGKIDLQDIGTVARHFGKTYP